MSAVYPLRASDRLHRLLGERGIHRYALFLVQQEGRELPGGVEAMSGFVLAADGSVHGFWLDWDPARGDYVLDRWYRIEDLSQFDTDPEYQRARRELGLKSSR